MTGLNEAQAQEIGISDSPTVALESFNPLYPPSWVVIPRLNAASTIEVLTVNGAQAFVRTDTSDAFAVYLVDIVGVTGYTGAIESGLKLHKNTCMICFDRVFWDTVHTELCQRHEQEH